MLRKISVSISHVSDTTSVKMVIGEFHNVNKRDIAVQHMDIVFVHLVNFLYESVQKIQLHVHNTFHFKEIMNLVSLYLNYWFLHRKIGRRCVLTYILFD